LKRELYLHNLEQEAHFSRRIAVKRTRTYSIKLTALSFFVISAITALPNKSIAAIPGDGICRDIYEQDLIPQSELDSYTPSQLLELIGKVREIYNGFRRVREISETNATAATLLERENLIDQLENLFGEYHLLAACEKITVAHIYMTFGRHEMAEELLLEEIESYQQSNRESDIIFSYYISSLADLYYSTGRFFEAGQIYENLLANDSVLFETAPRTLGSIYLSLSGIYFREDRIEESKQLANSALQIWRENLGPQHELVGQALIYLALADRRQGDYEAAISNIERALPILRNEGGQPSLYPLANALSTLAHIYWLQGSLQKAIDTQRQSIDIFNQAVTLNLPLGLESERINFLNTLLDSVIDFSVSFHLNEAPDSLNAAQNSVNSILLQKRRVLDSLAAGTNILGNQSNREAQELSIEINRLRTRVSNLAFLPQSEISDDVRQQQISEIEFQVKDLERQLSQISGQVQIYDNPVDFSHVSSLLPRGSVLVEFIRYKVFDPHEISGSSEGEERYAAYIVTQSGEIKGVDLGSASAIDTAVKDFITDISSANTSIGETKESAQILDSLMMREVRRHLGTINTIFIAPDGLLSLIPFEALVDEEDNFLVQEYQFRYLNSARDLVNLSRDSIVENSNPAVLVGDPRYSLNSGNPSYSEESERFIDIDQSFFPGLSGTRIEVSGISQLLPDAEIYTGTSATEAQVKAVRSPSILHIATHGFFGQVSEAEINPLLQSGLVLAGVQERRSGTGEDGVLSALEVAGLDLHGTQLVVLSACDTGLGELAASEGIYGLRRALTLAGARSQVLSLWSVEDQATQELMLDYYAHLLSGVPRDAALREAQLTFVNSADKRHPYYWAAFISSGDWRPLQQ
jgi:CHAT domain-containing protein